MGLKYKVEEGMTFPKIATGHYTGTIVSIQERTEPHKYTDFYVEADIPGLETKPKLKVGFPTFLSSTSLLGEFISEFVEMKVGIEIDIEAATIGKKIEFDIVNTPDSEDKTKFYPNIVRNTVKVVK